MVTAGSIAAGAALYVRDFIGSNVTDPLSGTRTGDEKFAMVGPFPQRPVRYPIVVVEPGAGMSDQSLGMRSTQRIVRVPQQVFVYGRNVKEKNQVSDEIYNKLATNRIDIGSAAGLYDFVLTGTSEIDDPAKGGVHARSLNVQWLFFG